MTTRFIQSRAMSVAAFQAVIAVAILALLSSLSAWAQEATVVSVDGAKTALIQQGSEKASQAIELEKRLKNATAVWAEAAELGNETAQYVMGVMYAWGLNGYPRDETKAMLHYYFSSLGGHIPAQMALGYRHSRGDGVPVNCKTAAVYYELAANAAIDRFAAAGGVEPGFLAERIQAPDEPKPEAKPYAERDVVDYYHNLASKGDSQAVGALGRIYYYGARGVGRDLERAYQLLLIAASKGDAASMSSLGHILLSGVPGAIEKDPYHAWTNFTAAAEAGNAGGHNGLGYMYLLGYPDVVTQDIAEAVRHFTRATEIGGLAEALYNLGAVYASSFKLHTRDFSRAYKYFFMAAQKGSILALHKVAHMTLHGIGTMRSCKTAVQYFKTVAERATFATELHNTFSDVFAGFKSAALEITLEQYLRLAEMGFEAGETNAARVMDEITSKSYSEEERNTLLGSLHYVLDLFGLSHPPLQGSADAMRLYERAAEQGNSKARVRVGDYFYYGQGDVGSPDFVEAAAHYRLASEHRESQASFNLGFQHQYGLGLAKDAHLAKRYYDLAKEHSPDARFAVSLVLTVLWIESAQRAFLSGERFLADDPAMANWFDWWRSPAGLIASPSLWSFDLAADTLLIIFLSGMFVGLGIYRERRNQIRRMEMMAAAARANEENNQPPVPT